MTERLPGPKNFPALRTMRHAQEISRLSARAGHSQTYRPCGCCGLACEVRTAQRHERACRRRKRLRPDMWAAWRSDMTGTPVERRGPYEIWPTSPYEFEVRHRREGSVGGAPTLQGARNLVADLRAADREGGGR